MSLGNVFRGRLVTFSTVQSLITYTTVKMLVFLNGDTAMNLQVLLSTVTYKG